MEQLIEAVLAVMDECKGVEKSMTVGSGQNSYKGVSDKDVKLLVGKAMQKHGLVIFPTDIEQKSTVTQWEETTQYGVKQKQSVFTEVITKYTLYHRSGASVQLVGFGHGTDTQDKSAGKATTYALKYTLLYTFLVATGHIDDSDNIHSDDLPTPKKQPAAKPALPELTPSHEKWQGAAQSLADGKATIETIRKYFTLSEANKAALVELAAEIDYHQTKEKNA